MEILDIFHCWANLVKPDMWLYIFTGPRKCCQWLKFRASPAESKRLAMGVYGMLQWKFPPCLILTLLLTSWSTVLKHDVDTSCDIYHRVFSTLLLSFSCFKTPFKKVTWRHRFWSKNRCSRSLVKSLFKAENYHPWKIKIIYRYFLISSHLFSDVP